MKTALAFISFLCFTVSLIVGQDDLDIRILFPGKSDINNWIKKDSITIYAGENLFSYINGGADLYLEYGFQDVAFCTYTNLALVDIHIEIYRMTSDSAAFGIFTINSSGNGKPADLGNKSNLYDYYLDFWKGSYYVRCISGKKDTELMDTLQMFAANVEKKIIYKGKEPQLTNIFKVDEFNFTDIKYITGLIGLGNVYNFGHGAISGFKEGVVGRSEERMLFVFCYTDDHNCREWFASAKGKMQMNQKFMDFEQKESGYIIKDKSGINYCFISYKRFIIILKGMDWENAQPLLEQIRKKLL